MLRRDEPRRPAADDGDYFTLSQNFVSQAKNDVDDLIYFTSE